jgi:hypothetical protein
MPSVDAFRAGLDEDVRQVVDLLREIIASAHDGLAERIKWNAPSFALGDDDLITLGLERRGGVRVVFHRGAKPKDAAGFIFEDPAGLARWPAADRGVAIFGDRDAVAEQREALRDLCVRWLNRVG